MKITEENKKYFVLAGVTAFFYVLCGLICRFVHEMTIVPIVLLVIGLVLIFVSYKIDAPYLALLASVGYILSFLAGFAFFHSADAEGMETAMSYWKVWPIAYGIICTFGLVISILQKKNVIDF